MNGRTLFRPNGAAPPAGPAPGESQQRQRSPSHPVEPTHEHQNQSGMLGLAVSAVDGNRPPPKRTLWKPLSVSNAVPSPIPSGANAETPGVSLSTGDKRRGRSVSPPLFGEGSTASRFNGDNGPSPPAVRVDPAVGIAADDQQHHAAPPVQGTTVAARLIQQMDEVLVPPEISARRRTPTPPPAHAHPPQLPASALQSDPRVPAKRTLFRPRGAADDSNSNSAAPSGQPMVSASPAGSNADLPRVAMSTTIAALSCFEAEERDVSDADLVREAQEDRQLAEDIAYTQNGCPIIENPESYEVNGGVVGNGDGPIPAAAAGVPPGEPLLSGRAASTQQPMPFVAPTPSTARRSDQLAGVPPPPNTPMGGASPPQAPSGPLNNEPTMLMSGQPSMQSMQGPSPPPPIQPPAPSPALQGFYGLPSHIQRGYERRGITKLYDWQHEILSRPDVLAGGSLVYSLPTSGGKTLVAELLLLRAALINRQSAMFVLPFVAVAEEKLLSLQEITKDAKMLNVEGFYGTNGRYPVTKQTSIFVCTMEKANSLWNQLREEDRCHEIGCVVVDELHMVGEKKRGATLELLLTKIMHTPRGVLKQPMTMSQPSPLTPQPPVAPTSISASAVGHHKQQMERYLEDCTAHAQLKAALQKQVEHRRHERSLARAGCQIIGMSATIPNLTELAEWLGASCYECGFRPVPLKQYAIVDGTVLEDGTKEVRQLEAMQGATEFSRVYQLCAEVMNEHSVLVFCSSRAQTVDTARNLAKAITAERQQIQAQKNAMDRRETAHEMRTLLSHGSNGPGTKSKDAQILQELIPLGVAYHHGGLLSEERSLIEHSYRAKRIRVLCCTSTLMAGVNLPARRVIIKSPFMGREFLTKSRYLQMCGRAGRAGLDDHGESFLILHKKGDQAPGIKLMGEAIEPTTSQMFGPDGELSKSLVECVSCGIATNRKTVEALGNSLLSAYTTVGAAVKIEERQGLVTGAIDQLVSSGLITAGAPQGGDQQLEAPNRSEDSTEDEAAGPLAARARETFSMTGFGSSSVRSCFTVDEATNVRRELEKLRTTGLITADDLHVCYFLTPVRDLHECDWMVYERLLNRLSEQRQRIAQMLGVDEGFVAQRAMGLPVPSVMSELFKQTLFTTKRFFVAMMLSDLLNEVPREEIEEKYSVSRGQIQQLLTQASYFASSIENFCAKMEWFMLQAVFSSFVKRLGYGVKPDLVPLMDVKGVQPPRARALWAAGFRDPRSLAETHPEEMVQRVKDAAGSKPNNAAKFFTLRHATAVVREANALLRRRLREQEGELDFAREQLHGGGIGAVGGGIGSGGGLMPQASSLNPL